MIKYETAEMELVIFQIEDVIATSDEIGDIENSGDLSDNENPGNLGDNESDIG